MSFRAVETIARKRDGLVLSTEEIQSLISGFVDGSVPDYQMAAFAMAVYFRGMTPVETAALLNATATGSSFGPAKAAAPAAVLPAATQR